MKQWKWTNSSCMKLSLCGGFPLLTGSVWGRIAPTVIVTFAVKCHRPGGNELERRAESDFTFFLKASSDSNSRRASSFWMCLGTSGMRKVRMNLKASSPCWNHRQSHYRHWVQGDRLICILSVLNRGKRTSFERYINTKWLDFYRMTYTVVKWQRTEEEGVTEWSVRVGQTAPVRVLEAEWEKSKCSTLHSLVLPSDRDSGKQLQQ